MSLVVALPWQITMLPPANIKRNKQTANYQRMVVIQEVWKGMSEFMRREEKQNTFVKYTIVKNRIRTQSNDPSKPVGSSPSSTPFAMPLSRTPWMYKTTFKLERRVVILMIYLFRSSPTSPQRMWRDSSSRIHVVTPELHTPDAEKPSSFKFEITLPHHYHVQYFVDM